jgi:hypothetical protein
MKCTGDWQSKLDRHDFTGLFLGYTSTNQNIRYLDLTSGLTKTCHHATFDEAWYLQDARPPVAQLLYQLGLKDNSSFTTRPPDRPFRVAHYPPLPSSTSALPNTAPAHMHHLPLHLSLEPHTPGAALHAITWSLHSGTCIAPTKTDTTMSLLYGVSVADVAQVYLSLTPYNDAFEEKIDLQKFDFTRHRAAGMTFLPQDNRLILTSIVPSTLGARIPHWRTRLRGAWLLSVNGTPVQTLADVHQAFHGLSLSQSASCILLFAHPKIPHGILNKGLPLLCCDQISQLSINQLSNHWTSKSDSTPNLPRAPTWDIVTDGDVRNVVMKVMKLTRGKP